MKRESSVVDRAAGVAGDAADERAERASPPSVATSASASVARAPYSRREKMSRP